MGRAIAAFPCSIGPHTENKQRHKPESNHRHDEDEHEPATLRHSSSGFTRKGRMNAAFTSSSDHPGMSCSSSFSALLGWYVGGFISTSVGCSAVGRFFDFFFVGIEIPPYHGQPTMLETPISPIKSQKTQQKINILGFLSAHGKRISSIRTTSRTSFHYQTSLPPLSCSEWRGKDRPADPYPLTVAYLPNLSARHPKRLRKFKENLTQAGGSILRRAIQRQP